MNGLAETTKFFAGLKSDPDEYTEGTAMLFDNNSSSEQSDTNENKELKREFESPEVEEFLREMQKEGLSQENSDYDLSKLSDENKENNSEETERKNSTSLELFDSEKISQKLEENQLSEENNTENNEVKNIEVDFAYLPMWSNNEALPKVLTELIENICPIDEIDAVGISMTAELVDAYDTKKDGVLDVVKKCEETFECPTAYVGIDGMLSKEEIEKTPLKAAAANWIATAQIATLISDNCIFIDTGSTTTDIIPIKDGKECAIGRSDFERLATGELVYTGTLRTNLASFLDKVQLHGKEYRVASELFAQTADVYTVLDLITLDDYVCDTFDGENKSKKSCMKRIARVLCADLDSLSEADVVELAKFTHQKQVEQIADALKQVSETQNLDLIVTTGLGKDILDKKAAEFLGLEVKSMDTILTDEECVVAPAVGTAVMMNRFLN